ncbi:hypothetical protein MTR67_011805 [Solanum verrucosum]|uniref:Uncharacterized protein n=1 Tax=Solanum verrucosum TaxID=315347 RepID=A0AAF0QBU0_SOLVR|nr:hypothetical protein MTR67_011805 [Solanum verrucosum]
MDEVQRWILSLLKSEERPTTRALKEGFISAELLTRNSPFLVVHIIHGRHIILPIQAKSLPMEEHIIIPIKAIHGKVPSHQSQATMERYHLLTNPSYNEKVSSPYQFKLSWRYHITNPSYHGGITLPIQTTMKRYHLLTNSSYHGDRIGLRGWFPGPFLRLVFVDECYYDEVLDGKCYYAEVFAANVIMPRSLPTSVIMPRCLPASVIMPRCLSASVIMSRSLPENVLEPMRNGSD